jgi:DNA-binding LytR/AlgR family response regulator
MDAAKELRDRDKTVKIIFLTSSPEFALQSYSVKATDYCIKPIAYQRLKEIMDDCTAFHRQEPENLTLKTVGGYQKIYFHDIECIEAQNKRVFFFLKSSKVVEVIQPLYTFETGLSDSKGFFKCHRSYLVYLPNVDYFNNTEIKTKSGRCIPIARGFGKAFQDAYFALMFQE